MRFPAPLSLSLFYLTSFGVLGVYLPYFNIYLTTLDLGGLQIGIVSALLPLCGAIVSSAGGLLRQRLGLRRGRRVARCSYSARCVCEFQDAACCSNDSL